MADSPAIHEDEIVARRRARETAAAVLAGNLPCLRGALALLSLLDCCRVPQGDSDQLTLLSIASAIDHLPLGPERDHWAPAALERMAPEISAAEEHAGEAVIRVCNNIMARFDAV